MKKTYTVVLRRAYHAAKRRVFAFGQVINFVDGIAGNVSEAVALELKRRNLITEMRPEYILEEVDRGEAVLSGFTPPVTFYDFEDEVGIESEQPEFTDAELEDMGMIEPTIENLPELPEPPLSLDEQEVLAEEVGEEITKELIETLYEELGTWSAVASQLGITTTRLKKYRDEFGI